MSNRANRSNPALFRRLSEPYASMEAADEAIQTFLDEMGALREKHKIPNILTVIGGSAIAADGDESEFLLPHMYGDAMRMESFAAYAYGAAATARQEALGAIQKGSLKRTRPGLFDEQK
jgi:hypothetical protein